MIKGQQPAAQSGLPLRRKILYYGLMLVLTLLTLEGRTVVDAVSCRALRPPGGCN